MTDEVNDIPEDTSDESTSLLQLSDSNYNRLKALVTVILPGLGTLYAAIGPIWDLAEPEKVLGTLVAVTTFLGIILRISTKKYNKSDAKFDGQIEVIPGETEDLLNVSIDPAAVAGKDSIQLKITNPSA